MSTTEVVVRPETRIQRNLAKAVEKAARGDAFHAELLTDAARTIADEAGIALSKRRQSQISDILQRANAKAVDVALRQASAEALEGNAYEAGLFADAARVHAQRAGFALSRQREAQIESIVRREHVNAVVVDLKDASVSAERGDARNAELKIDAARVNAKRVGITLDEHDEALIEQILKQANTNAVGVKLAEASHAAASGNVGYVDSLTDAALLSARRASASLSKEQQSEVSAIVKQ